ncbi:nucleotide disphospho-sugar-binding domain-containing protein [Spirosoma gilvum]
MRTILFLLLPIPSHYYPTFGLARLLQHRGYRIIYMGKPHLQEIVEQEGFDFETLIYAEEFVIRRLKVAIGLFVKSRLDASYMRGRYREFLFRNGLFEQVIKRLRPEIVFLDDTMGLYYPVLAGKTTVVQLSTKLSPRKKPGVPPINCFWEPNNVYTDELISEWFWFWHIQKRRLKNQIQRFVFNGRHDAYFQQKYDQTRSVRWVDVREEKTSLYAGLKNIPSVVLAPIELEFSWTKPHPQEIYMALPTARNEQKRFFGAYQNLLAKLLIYQKEYAHKIVYVSLGSLAHCKPQVSRRFIQNAITALRRLENVQAIISTGDIELGLHSMPVNIHLLSTVPQLQLLTFCDLMITHGGLGTIKECLEAGVPMLVYSLNKRVDQPGNSARVVSHQFGLRGKITDSATSIQQKVNALLKIPVYRANCQIMRQRSSQINTNQLVDAFLQRIGFWETDLANHIDNFFTIYFLSFMKKVLLNFADVMLSREQMKVVLGGAGEGGEDDDSAGKTLSCYATTSPPPPQMPYPIVLGTIKVTTCSPTSGVTLLQQCRNTWSSTEYTSCF